MHDFSKRALFSFIDNAIDKGRINVNTGGGIRAACNKLLEQVAPDDDVRSLDLKAAVVQYANRHPGELSGDSLRVYESRVRTAIDAFVQAATDPTSFSFRSKGVPGNGAKRARSAKAVTTKAIDVPSADPERAQHGDGPSPSPGTKTASLRVPFPLRTDFLAEIVIPRDLTKDEAKRLMAFVDALSQDPPSQA
jgi:hypothetical protein